MMTNNFLSTLLADFSEFHIQYKSHLSSYAKRIWFLANAFAPALGNTQMSLDLL